MHQQILRWVLIIPDRLPDYFAHPARDIHGSHTSPGGFGAEDGLVVGCVVTEAHMMYVFGHEDWGGELGEVWGGE